MPAFRFVAVDPAGQTLRGVMEAATDAEVVARLQGEGNIPISARPAGGVWSRLLAMEFGRRGMGRQAVADMTRELAVMLTAGQDLDRTLRFIAERAPNRRVFASVDALRRSVRDGGTLAGALAEQPGTFPRLYVGLVRAGEAGGTLAPTLERLSALMEAERSLAATVRSALVYPAMLVIVALGSITLLLTEVLPQFVPLFEQSGAALPGPTQVLIQAGDLVSAYGLHALLLLAGLGFAAGQALKRPALRLLADRALLRIPVVGGLTREVVAARFTRTLGTLLVNGVPLVAALGIVLDAVGNAAAVRSIERATLSVKDGAGLAGPLREGGVFPPQTTDLVGLGEETAQLGTMALRAAVIHEERTRLGVQRLVALLVPAVTIAMGTAIAGIVSSLLLAMLGLNDLAAG